MRRNSQSSTSSADGPLTGLPGQTVLPCCTDDFNGADSVAADLSPKLERFCREYIIDRNGTRAHQRAFCSAYNTARTEASKLLAKTNIARRIEELEEARRERLDITADRVLQRLAMLAFANVRDFYDDRGELIPIHELDHDVAAAISSFETIGGKSGIVTKVKLHDQKAALELLGKTEKLKLFRENVNLNHAFGEYSDEELEELARQKAAALLSGAAE
jgi:phage terminase small subunit